MATHKGTCAIECPIQTCAHRPPPPSGLLSLLPLRHDLRVVGTFHLLGVGRFANFEIGPLSWRCGFVVSDSCWGQCDVSWVQSCWGCDF